MAVCEGPNGNPVAALFGQSTLIKDSTSATRMDREVRYTQVSARVQSVHTPVGNPRRSSGLKC